MTEEKKSMVPKLRFPEFTETWEQRKLEDICDVRDGTHSSPKYFDNGFPLVTSKNLRDGVIDLSDVQLISKEDYLEINKRSKVDLNDILMSMIGTIGNLALIKEEPTFAIKNVALIKSTDKVKMDYLFSYLSSPSSKCDIDKSVEGGTQKFLSLTKVRGLKILLPGIEEQQKIGSFSVLLDGVITLHQRKLDVLNKLKKYLLQKMFPENGQLIPELRFPAFSGAWEQRKLSEIVRMNARIGWQNLRQSEFLDDGDFLLITGTDFKNGRVNFGTCHYIAKERFDQDPKIQVEEGSILLTKDGTIGKVALVDKLSKPATLNAGVYNIVPKNRVVESRFLFQYLSAPFLLDYVNKAATGGTIKHLNQSILVDFPVSFPSVAEQEKIGKFLEGIDHVTTLHQRKLEGLRKLKKSLLQQMFV